MPVIAVILRVWFAVVLIFTPALHPFTEIFDIEFPVTPLAPVEPAAPLAAQAVRVSQIYGGGASSGAVYPCDFVELFNASSQRIVMQNWSLQYATATGTTWSPISLGNREIAPYSYFLVGGTCTSGSGSPPVPPEFSTGALFMDVAKAKVALASNMERITGVNDPDVIDFVGYGSVTMYEGSGPAPQPGPSLADFRKEGGCTDTDDNAADFALAPVAPRNSASPVHTCPEAAPRVQSTSPANNASDVALDANVIVAFNEPVTPGPGWFEVRCELGGVRGPAEASISGGPTSFTIDLNAHLLGDDACRLTIFADAIHDNDTNDPPDTLAVDTIVDFRTVPGNCGDPAYAIHDVQGAGSSSPAAELRRTIEGVVTGDFQGPEELSGYFVQEETVQADFDPTTSEAIFIDEHTRSSGEVAAGTRVRVTGVVREMDGLTSLTEATRVVDCGSAEAPAAADLTLPFAAAEGWEQYEGMLVRFGAELVVTESEHLGSEGRLTLVAGERVTAYTQNHGPDVAGFAAWADDLAQRTIVLDDGSEQAYPDPIRYPPPALTAANSVRVGDTVEADLTGVVDYRDGATLIQPTSGVSFITGQPRPVEPAQRGGNLRVAFMSLDDYFNVTSGEGGPRGASNAEEFTRQRNKLIQALARLDADVIGVSKLENDGYGPEAAIADLVDGLNAATAPQAYTFIDPETTGWGSDAVAVGLLYRTAAVTPIGAPTRLETGAFDQGSGSPLHRAPMAQTFEERSWGERFTVVVNEWHDRSECPAGGADADAGDGQACWNASRTEAAEDLTDWLALDPTASGDGDVLVVGELNTFPQEDPIQVLDHRGYEDLVGGYIGTEAVTAVLDGSAGYTTHTLASASMAEQVVGVATWNINAEEPQALDYQLEHKSAEQQASLYAPDPYRSSPQNPLLVDLSLVADQSDLGGAYGLAWHTGQGIWRLGEGWGGVDDGALAGPGSWNDGQGELTVSVNGPAEQYACLYGWLDFSDGTVQAGLLEEADGDWDASENVIQGVPLQPGADQLVTFAMPVGVLTPGAMLNLRLRLAPAADPGIPACTGGGLQPAEALGPTGRADGGEVEDHVIDAPLAAELNLFTAEVNGTSVMLRWETASETGVAGFDLRRSRSLEGPWAQVKPGGIPASAPGAGLGNAYRYDDSTVTPGQWWYRLDALDLDGQTTELGTIQVEVLAPNALRLAHFHSTAVRSGWLITLLTGLTLAAAGVLLAWKHRA